jgi:hypothetical protein
MNAKRFRASPRTLVTFRERPVGIHSRSRSISVQIDDFAHLR